MNDSFDHKPQNEIDIVALFEYFKNGIKSVFRGIANFFKWIFRLILNFLYLIFKNWALVFGLTIIFGLLGLFKDKWLDKKYKYEMVVEPQMESAFDLYDNISHLNTIAESDLQSVEGLNGVQSFEIEPVKRYLDEISLYYAVPKSKIITGAPDMFGYERDTVFYRSTEFNDFKTELANTDYPVQKIMVKSHNPLNTDALKSLILQPFEQNENWQRMNNARKERMQQRLETTRNTIARSDSLLRAYALNPQINQSAEVRISGSSAENNVELDLLQQIKGFSDQLEILQYNISNSNNVLNILSDFKRVEDDSMRSQLNLWTGLLIGFLLSLLILLLLYLLKFFRTYQPR